MGRHLARTLMGWGVALAAFLCLVALLVGLPFGNTVALAEPEPTPVYIMWSYLGVAYPDDPDSPSELSVPYTGQTISFAAVAIDATLGYQNPTPLEGLFVDITYTLANVGVEVEPIVATGYTATATLRGEGVDADLYTIAAFGSIDFSIVKRGVTVQWQSTQFVYDGEEHTPAYTLQAVKMAYEQDVQVALPTLTDSAPHQDVGDYTATATLSGMDRNYYYIDVAGTEASSSSVDYSIAPRAITVGIADSDSVYGEDLATLSATVVEGSLVEGQVDADVYTLSTSATLGAPAGRYVIYGTAIDDNYDVTFRRADGAENTPTYTVNQRPITVTASPRQSIYGEQIAALYYTLQGSVVGEDEVFSLSCMADGEPLTARTPVGAYTIEIVDAGNANYLLTVVQAEYTVLPRPVTIAAENRASVYGDPVLELTGVAVYGNQSVGLDEEKVAVLEGDEFYTYVCLVDGLPIAADSNVGEYDICVVCTSGDVYDNYDVTLVPATYTISPRALTVHIDDGTGVYGDALAPLTAEDGVVQGGVDGLYTLTSSAYTLAETGTTPAGSYRIDGEALTDNYDITFMSGTYSVLPRMVTLRWDADRYIYDGLPHLPTPTLGNVVEGDDVTVTHQGEQVDAGIYVAIVTSISNANYVLPQGAVAAFVIEKAPARFDLASVQTVFYYSGEAQSISGASATGEVTYLDNAFVAIGTHVVTVLSAESDNYLAGQTTITVEVLEALPLVDEDTGYNLFVKDLDDIAGGGMQIDTTFRNAALVAGEAKGVLLRQGDVGISFDAKAIEAIAAEEAAISLAQYGLAGVVAADDVVDAEWLATHGLPDGTQWVLDVTWTGADMGAGQATVTAAFAASPPHGQIARVYYLGEDGRVEDMHATFDNGTLSFSTTHFSRFAVVFEPKLSRSATLGILLGGFAFAGLVFALVYLLLVRKSVQRAKQSATIPPPEEQ